jgi:hypothetical protein
MKAGRPATLSRRMRLALSKQVQEYVDNYYPEWGYVSVKISLEGAFASVRKTEPKQRDAPKRVR